METHNQWPFIVLAVLLESKYVDAKSCHGIQECKNGYGDEELCWRRIIPNQEETISPAIPAGGGIEIYLMEPGRHTVENNKGLRFGWNKSEMVNVYLQELNGCESKYILDHVYPKWLHHKQFELIINNLCCTKPNTTKNSAS